MAQMGDLAASASRGGSVDDEGGPPSIRGKLCGDKLARSGHGSRSSAYLPLERKEGQLAVQEDVPVLEHCACDCTGSGAAAVSAAGSSSDVASLHLQSSRDGAAVKVQQLPALVQTAVPESGGAGGLLQAALLCKEVSSFTQLHAAAAIGSIELVRQQLQLGGLEAAAVADSLGCTPLHLAAEVGGSHLMELLAAAAPSSLTALDKDHRTPLHLAVLRGNEAAVRTLLALAPQAARVVDATGSAPIHLAASKGSAKLTEMLLRAAPEAAVVQDNEGLLPAQIALGKAGWALEAGGSRRAQQHLEVVRCLLAASAREAGSGLPQFTREWCVSLLQGLPPQAERTLRKALL